MTDRRPEGRVLTTRALNRAVLLIEPVAPLPPADRAAVEAEGARLLAFLATEGGPGEVRFA